MTCTLSIYLIAVKDELVLPKEVEKEGYCLATLKIAFTRAQEELPVLAFVKKPTLKFYKELHMFLTHWKYSRDAGITAIGRFYNAIDPYLRQREFLPFNAFRYIDQQVQRCCEFNSTATIQYDLKSKTHTVHSEERMPELDHDVLELKKKLAVSEQNTAIAEKGLSDLTKKMDKMKRSYERKLEKLNNTNEDLYQEILMWEEELQKILSKPDMLGLVQDISDEIGEVANQQPILECTTDKTEDVSMMGFCYETKQGKTYSSAVRKLYYSLLSANLPPGKIAYTIKTVLHHLIPKVDVSKICLPQHSCALYMRREELTTVNSVHKAVKLTGKGEKIMHINSDGTTLQQRKVGATAVNGMVLSVNELPNGSAEAIARDISEELDKLRAIAKALELPNADSINWSIVASTTSDSAATQKKFNDIVVKLKKQDREKFGETISDLGKDLISNFCAMHLGVNLRKAFLEGSEFDKLESTNRKYSETDTLVHEFCKLFGTKGVPEYGVGSTSFQDFLAVQTTSDRDNSDYYEKCMKVTLERQVGSRYFVTASNAAKVLFLGDAAQKYLLTFAKNKLEREVLTKLKDSHARANLKADGLMFVHVYADLVTLAKSEELNKNALDMTIHYLELSGFLEHLTDDPTIAFDVEMQVYKTERRLYDAKSNLNHRIKPKNLFVYQRLFVTDPTYDTLVLEKLAKGAASMRNKLKVYAKDYLPSGRYWSPPEHVANILRGIKPTNDICESILGLNDWLQTAIPNVCQLTKRNLIEAKKNKTMEWFDNIPSNKQDEIVQMAVKRKADVKDSYKQHVEAVKGERQAALRTAMQKKEYKDEKQQQLKTDLAHIMALVDSTSFEIISDRIEKSNQISKSKKDGMKLEILKTQLKVRQMLLDKPIKFYFTKGGKKIPLSQLIQSFKSMLDNYPVPDPKTMLKHFQFVTSGGLVGKEIMHRFSDKTTQGKWYTGHVLAYDKKTNEYEVAYKDEDEPCYFDLAVDSVMGHLKTH